MFETDAIVIGAGAVGLAVARALALRRQEVVVLEREPSIGSHTSSRNSEVIHAGIYYPGDSLKARLCVEGKQRLYQFCESRKVPHARCGKLIVAVDAAQVAKIEALTERAARNGVNNLAMMSAAAVHQREPEVRASAALSSPSTGILDSHQYMLSLLGECEDHGGALALNAPFLGAEPAGGGFRIRVGGAEPTEIAARLLVNSAGLFATETARGIEGLPAEHVRTTYFAKGNYFVLRHRAPFRQLIYPVPERGGLGVHATLDLAGAARFGPDVEWCDGVDYRLDTGRAPAFEAAIRRYWPGLGEGALMPGYVGVRPKLSRRDEPTADFALDGPSVHGVAGLVNLFGIESPGITASLAIAEMVADMLEA